jgi:hypothetical protein
VSTPIYGAFLVTAKKTLAVFIQTHGSSINCSIVSGILEPYFSFKIVHVLTIFLALLLKKEIESINIVISSTHSSIQSSGTFKNSKKFLFTLFTCLSVA